MREIDADAVYEAAFAPERWKSAIDSVGREVGAVSGAIVMGDIEPRAWIATDNAEAAMSRIAAEGGLRQGRYPRAVLDAHRAPRFYSDHEDFSAAELAEEPLFREYFLPIGMLWGVSTSFFLPTGDRILAGWRRVVRSEPFGRRELEMLDALRPHLGRATFIAARLRSAAARAAAATLAALGLPAFVVDDLGRIVEGNSLVDQIAPLIVYGARNRFTFCDAAAAEQFRTAVGTIADDAARAPRSFVVRDETGAPARIAHIVPIRLAALDIFSRCTAALILTPLAEPAVPPVEILRSLFDLTAREASVARALASGADIDAIAAAERISRNTVRAHLRMLMAKTGCSRQAELVALFAGLRPPGR